MVTQIQLGNFFSANGRTVLGGVSGSGLDTEGLIDALIQARSLPKVALEDKVTLNGEKTSALNEFKTLLGQFKSALDALRNPPGVNNAASNAFKFTSASAVSNTSVEASSYLSVSSSPGAAHQSYTVSEITSLAAARKQRTGNISIASTGSQAVFTAPGAGLFKAGTFTLNGESITLADGDTLAGVAAKFNAVSQDTGIAASIITVADGTYRVSFSATHTGTDYDFDFNDAGTLTDPDGVFDQITVSDTQDASDAEFIIDDITITRSTNTVSDAVDGVTFTLLAETPALTELTVSVEADAQTVRGSVINLANVYNDIRLFFAKQTQVNDDGTFADTAILASNSAFRTIVNNITAQMTSIVSGLADGDPSRLSELGMSFVTLPSDSENPAITNALNIDDDALSAAIAADFDAVRRVFEFDFVSSNPSLRIFSRTNALGASAFTLTITPGSDIYQATYNNGGGPVTIDLDAESVSGGIRLTGQEGTVLEGLVLVYASTSNASISVTATQGIADKLYNIAEPSVRNDTGTLDLELDALQTSDARLEAEMARIDEQVERYREQLLQKFGALESILAKVNTLLLGIDANNQARQNS